MIRSIYINNFKSLVDFTIELDKFTCLIGLNGSGKSTVLQAVDFVSQLFNGQVENWLKKREWNKTDINSKLISQSNIGIIVELALEENKILEWSGTLNRNTLRCTHEYLVLESFDALDTELESKSLLLAVNNKKYRLRGSYKPINFTYKGSILSQLSDSELSDDLKKVKEAFASIKSLELLSPHLMKKNSRGDFFEVGIGGEKLPSFLHGIGGEAKKELLEKLEDFYPQFASYGIRSRQYDWRKLSITENYNKKLVTESKHINDGFLRVLTIIAQAITTRDRGAYPFLLLDEIENGINPEIIGKLVSFLTSASSPQTLATTHSPLILNYLEDEQAKKSVKLIFKNKAGATRQKPFFDHPVTSKKLEALGPGEVLLDTYLEDIIADLISEESEKA